MSGKKIAKEIVLWLLTLLLCVLFFKTGIAKFDEKGGWSTMFRKYGFPVWFRIAIGAIEAAAALLLLWPRTAAYGAITIIVVMIGAVGTQIVHHDLNPVPLVALVLAAILAASRWKPNQFPLPRAGEG